MIWLLPISLICGVIGFVVCVVLAGRRVTELEIENFLLRVELERLERERLEREVVVAFRGEVNAN